MNFMKNKKCSIINVNGIRFDLELINFFDKINYFLQKINFVYILENYSNKIKL